MFIFNKFSILMIAIFFVGYLCIVFEQFIGMKKKIIALVMGILCWIIQFSNNNISVNANIHYLLGYLSKISQIIIFILGAMIIVEIINLHKGFNIITNYIKTYSKIKLLWLVGILTFFLSAILDNLATTIVMIFIIQKIVENPKNRLLICGGIIIAANAGGVWSPIGDITTTMLWIGGKISTLNILKDLFIPSLASFFASFVYLTFLLKKEKSIENTVENIKKNDFKEDNTVLKKETAAFSSSSKFLKNKYFDLSEIVIKKKNKRFFVLILGLASLMFVPIFRLLTGLPPFIGMVISVITFWFFGDFLYCKRNKLYYLKRRVVFSKLELSGPMFFLGVLLAINALQSAGILSQVAFLMEKSISNVNIIAIIIGFMSSVVDNIPLVAASIGMYDIIQYPMNSDLWKLIAYCAGTGGSIFIIGSAAGIVYMNMEKIKFFSYLKKITMPALLGYFVGILVYFILSKCNL